jgi:putative phosphoribosyl transferase
MFERTFRDRREAGRVLAGSLTAYRGRTDVVVLGLARGGVPVGWELAAALGVPFDVFLVRKLGAPQWPELAMGAIASGGAVVLNESVRHDLHITDAQLQEVLERESAELHRRESTYRAGRGPVDVKARSVLLVDDGIATGASLRVALQALRAASPARLVVAVPVGPRRACRELRAAADELVCWSTPARFEAVGQAYADFHQIGDQEVRELLNTPTTAH